MIHCNMPKQCTIIQTEKTLVNFFSLVVDLETKSSKIYKLWRKWDVVKKLKLFTAKSKDAKLCQ